MYQPRASAWHPPSCTVRAALGTGPRWLEVRYYAVPACRGARDSLGGVPGAGPPLEPDEPGHLEFEGAFDPDTGAELSLTPAEEEVALEAVARSLC
jgi:hypothetical protein